jgi:hypothetical protein
VIIEKFFICKERQTLILVHVCFQKVKKNQYFPAMAELLSKLEEEKDEPKTPSWPPRCGWWNNWCRGTGGKWKENKDEKGFVIFLKFRFVPYATAGLRVKTSVPLEHLFRHGRFDTATLPLFPPNWAQTFWYVLGISQTMSPTHQFFFTI